MVNLSKRARQNNKGDQPIFITGLALCALHGLIYDNRFCLSGFSVLATRILYILAAIIFLGNIVITKKSLELHDSVLLIHYATISLGCLIISIALLMKSRQFKDYCKLLEDEFKYIRVELSPIQEKIMKDTSTYLITFIKIMVPFYYSAALINSLSGPLFKGTPLPYNGWLPFDIDTWPKYILAFSVETLIPLNNASSLYFAVQAYVIHGKQICAQFDILCSHIKTTFDYTDDSSRYYLISSQREEFIKSRISYAIERHQVLIKCFNMFQEVYSGLLFAMTLVSAIMICTNVFMITDPNSSPAVISEFAILLTPEAIFITMYCWYGQKVANRWEDVRNTVYEIDWFKESIKTQKSLLNIMTVSTKSKIIRGGGLQAFTMQGYAEILQASFSYFNMLKALR